MLTGDMYDRGVVNMYGVFQTFYESNLLKYEPTSNISWVGSIQGFLIFFGGAIVSPFFDLGYLGTLLYLGTFGVVFGMMMTSLCTTYWHFVLAQGITVGMGFGCLFLPSVAIISQHFTTKKSIAFGITSTGGSVGKYGPTYPERLWLTPCSLGGVLYPIIFRQIQPRIGFPWTTRTIAFIVLTTQLVPLLGMRLRTPSSTKRHDFLDLAAFKSPPYLLFCIAVFFGFMAIYVTFFYIELYALEKTDIDSSLASYLLSIVNAASTIGRLVPNFLADMTGPLNIQIPFAFILTTLCFVWIRINTTAGTVVFCLLYGFFCGSFVSLPGVTIMSLSPNLATIGIQLGMSFTIAGCGLLIGEPIAGAILRGQGGWIGLQVFCGVLLAVSGFFSFAARFAKVGNKWSAKA